MPLIPAHELSRDEFLELDRLFGVIYNTAQSILDIADPLRKDGREITRLGVEACYLRARAEDLRHTPIAELLCTFD